MKSKFISACGRAGPAFEATKEVLDAIADFIAPPGKRHLAFTVGLPWKAMPVAEGCESGAQFVTVESLVANDDDRHLFVRQQIEDMCAFISLPRNEFHTQRPAFEIGNHHELGVASAAGLAHGLRGGAAGRISGTLMGQDMGAVDEPDPALEFFGDGFEQPGPKAFAGPLPEISEDGFPWPKFRGQIPPRPGISQPVE